MATLLNNLKVQERQLRVCTTVAIAIVSETCAPFTVLPAIMNEYRVPEINVQNGVLKALSFMFEVSLWLCCFVSILVADLIVDSQNGNMNVLVEYFGSSGFFCFFCKVFDLLM
ncbi:unnamed protein product [Anisakis simplex]|uniref:Phosphatase PP2A regulatory subunit A/Splicing factor 3B subunit 1-like HEAT repeat domain-containing protein n=1 Tax=Anisakis simplex TaxID=6269 RepID=A0A3P6PJF5_ANISI|nr:unnamed protein product [Anisakis simplex]